MVRRMHIKDSKEVILDELVDHGSLRTLLLPCLGKIAEDAIPKFKCLRILDIRESSISNLPNSIGDIVHLKYLCVSKTAIREIPESIGNLRNLQFLIMDDCNNLCSIPMSITNLFNPRCLSFENTGLRSVPTGFAKLKNLIQFYGFLDLRSNNDNGYEEESRRHCNLQELGSLTQLMSLGLSNLDSTCSKEKARAAALEDKPKLTF